MHIITTCNLVPIFAFIFMCQIIEAITFDIYLVEKISDGIYCYFFYSS